jgi:hypothetical protein
MGIFRSVALLAPAIWVIRASQIPLGISSAVEDDSYGTPFDKFFNELAKKSMEEFKVPGLSIAVVSGNKTYSTVCHSSTRKKNDLI